MAKGSTEASSGDWHINMLVIIPAGKDTAIQLCYEQTVQVDSTNFNGDLDNHVILCIRSRVNRCTHTHI